MTIIKLSSKDVNVIWQIINEASSAYKGVIPDDCYHEPYMPKEALHREIESMVFFGWQE